MPKTSIYAATYPGDLSRQIRCEIGWARGYDVQIAVTQLAEGCEPTDEFVTHDETALTITAGGHLVPQAATIANGPTGDALQPAWQGQRMTLSREQINNLIRALRDARDAAYGRDE